MSVAIPISCTRVEELCWQSCQLQGRWLGNQRSSWNKWKCRRDLPTGRLVTVPSLQPTQNRRLLRSWWVCACMCAQFAALSSVSFVDDCWPQCCTVGHSLLALRGQAWNGSLPIRLRVYPAQPWSELYFWQKSMTPLWCPPTLCPSIPHPFLAKEPRVRGVAVSLPFFHLTHIP